MPVNPEQQRRDRRRARRDASRRAAPPCRRSRRSSTSRSRCSTTALSASSTTWATTARSCRRRASPTGAAPAGQRGPRPHQLSDAAPAHDAVRDVRDQVPRQAADLCRAAMDPAPHRQRQRVLGALFDPRQRVLHPGARASGGQADDQPPGPRRGARGRAGAARVLDLLREDAERAYAGYAEMLNEDETGAPRDPPGPASRASSPA